MLRIRVCWGRPGVSPFIILLKQPYQSPPKLRVAAFRRSLCVPAGAVEAWCDDYTEAWSMLYGDLARSDQQ